MAKPGRRNWERQEFAHVFPSSARGMTGKRYCATFGHHPFYPSGKVSVCRDCDEFLRRVGDIWVPAVTPADCLAEAE